jgi:hypothetical protein
LDKCRSVFEVLFVGAVLIVVSNANILFPAGPAKEMDALALPKEDVALQLHNEHEHVDDYDNKLIQRTHFTSNEAGTTKIVPLSSGSSNSGSGSGNSYGHSGSTGVSVQQNVTQQNVCSSNTAYCYNEVDNDFNVNPP